MRRATLVLALALALAALAGCGGSTEPLTHDEYVAKADEICAEYNAKFEDVLGGLTEQSSDAARNDALEKYVSHYGDMADDVSELEPPESDRVLAQFVDRLKRNARGFEEAADKGELMSDTSGNRAYNSLKEARTLAEQAGLGACSEANS